MLTWLREFRVSARFGLNFNLSCLLFVSALWGAATVTGWVHSVVFISHVSMLALVLSCLGAIFASRVEVKQEDDADVREVLDRLNQLAERLSADASGLDEVHSEPLTERAP